jgi:hypothetical protein
VPRVPTAVGAITDFVTDGEDGFLVAPCAPRKVTRSSNARRTTSRRNTGSWASFSTTPQSRKRASGWRASTAGICVEQIPDAFGPGKPPHEEDAALSGTKPRTSLADRITEERDVGDVGRAPSFPSAETAFRRAAGRFLMTPVHRVIVLGRRTARFREAWQTTGRPNRRAAALKILSQYFAGDLSRLITALTRFWPGVVIVHAAPNYAILMSCTPPSGGGNGPTTSNLGRAPTSRNVRTDGLTSKRAIELHDTRADWTVHLT